jgi:hypothetical protein
MSRDEILGAIRSLSADERLGELVVAILERRSERMSAPISMIATVTAMAKYLSHRDQILLAEIMRDAADHVEHRRRQLVRID